MLNIIKNKRYGLFKGKQKVADFQYMRDAKKEKQKLEKIEAKKEVEKVGGSSKCRWNQYIIPEATGYKKYNERGTPVWVTVPPPPAPKVKYEDYRYCERIELNDAVKIARPIARKLKMGRNAGSRANILNHADRRGVKALRTQLGGGKEGIYIPKPLLDEFIENMYERDRRRHPENRVMK